MKWHVKKGFLLFTNLKAMNKCIECIKFLNIISTVVEMDTHTEEIDTCSLIVNWWFVYALIDCLVCLVEEDNHTHAQNGKVK